MPDKALILGINSYKSVSSLRGCVNDTDNMRRLLTETLGFPPGQRAHSSRTGRSSRAASRPQLNWLFEGVWAGDRVVFHFSGHGSYTADTDEEDERACDELHLPARHGLRPPAELLPRRRAAANGRRSSPRGRT